MKLFLCLRMLYKKLLREKIGCTDLLVWLGFGLARHNQNIYLEKFTINQYFGDIQGLIIKVQNNYKWLPIIKIKLLN